VIIQDLLELSFTQNLSGPGREHEKRDIGETPIDVQDSD
jgi:hypothetical protein